MQEATGCTAGGERTNTYKEQAWDHHSVCKIQLKHKYILYTHVNTCQGSSSFTKMSNEGCTNGASCTTEMLADVSSKKNRCGLVSRCYPHL